MIAIIDYGLGNVRAFANVYAKSEIPFVVATTERQLRDADKLVLPGVGSFDHAMVSLEKSGMKACLTEMVLSAGIPVLGVCVGMQMMAIASEEGTCPGLGWIKGTVRRLPVSSGDPHLRVPHIGWNSINVVAATGLMDGIAGQSAFYFLHSYYLSCERESDVLAYTEYGGEFACAVGVGRIFGVQFHPEKSHGWGTKLLENFARV